MTEAVIFPLCRSVEPTGMEAMCSRPEGHPGMHRTAIVDDDGTTIIEWYDVDHIKSVMKRALGER